jgi:hypothetical protein
MKSVNLLSIYNESVIFYNTGPCSYRLLRGSATGHLSIDPLLAVACLVSGVGLCRTEMHNGPLQKKEKLII